MDIHEFNKMLLPARKRLSRIHWQASLVVAVNFLAIIILSVALLVLFNNFIIAAATGFIIDMPCILILFLFIVVVIGVWLGSQFFCKIKYNQVVLKLDTISNNHNLISTAAEFIESGRESDFAQIAIMRGVDTLQSISPKSLSQPLPSFKIIYFMAAFGAIATLLVAVNGPGSQQYYSEQKAIPDDKFNNNQPIPFLSSHLHHHNSDADGLSGSVGSMNSSDIFKPSSSNRVGSSASEAKGSAVENLALKRTVKQSNEKVSGQIGDLSDIKNTNISGAGTAVTPPVESNTIVDHLDVYASLDEDQLQAKAKDKKARKNFSSSSERPFADDYRTAPGRELGRSGRKGKPGNGRGGLGAVKKSRSTAALFPGQMITVHVPSQQGKGKSKSFEVQVPMQQQDNVDRSTLVTGQSFEGRFCSELIKPSLQIITKQYFEELNAYANGTFKASTETN